MIVAVVAGAVWFLGNEDMRAEIVDWLDVQVDAASARVRAFTDSIEAPASSAQVRSVPTTAAQPALPAGQARVSATEMPSSRSIESTAPSGKFPGEGPLDRDEVERWIVGFTNDERERAGLQAFVHDPAISDIARAHSEEMVRHGLSHELRGRDPTDRALAAGYDCRAFRGDGSSSYGLSENIAEHPRVTNWSGFGIGGGPTRWRPVEFDSDSRAMALGLVKGLMESPGHRANILDRDARRIGVGVAITEAPENGWTHETVFATQNFSACR